MKKLLIACLILAVNYFLTGCSTISSEEENRSSQYDTIISYFKLRQKYDLKPTTRKIFVLTENGCGTCNKKFADLAETYLSDSTSLILLAMEGMIVDINKFNGRKNVLLDQSVRETDYKLFHHSKVIFFDPNGQAIDTIVNIDARFLEQQFEFIKKRK